MSSTRRRWSLRMMFNPLWVAVALGATSTPNDVIPRTNCGLIGAGQRSLSQMEKFSPRWRNKDVLSEVREISGTWKNEFEGSEFFADGLQVPQDEHNKHRVWLHVDDQTIVPNDFRPDLGGTYRLKIQACSAPTRQFRDRAGGYGHFGLFSGLIVVDEVLEWEVLTPVNAPSASQAPSS